MKTLIAVIAAALLFGCSAKITLVEICPEVDEWGQLDLYIDTTGSSLTTTTDQKADGQLELSVPLEGL